MSRRPRFSLAARQDVEEYAIHIAFESPEVARRFAPAAVSAANHLCVYPHIGAELTLPGLRLLGVRRWAIGEFPRHVLVYRVRPSTIDVLRVTHGARDLPRVLRKLLREPDAREF